MDQNRMGWVMFGGAVGGLAVWAALALMPEPDPVPPGPADPVEGEKWRVFEEARRITEQAAAEEA